MKIRIKKFKVRVVTNKATITAIGIELPSIPFNDLYKMVAYVNEFKIKITNPEALPLAFQRQLIH